jgi:hypothetical protein
LLLSSSKVARATVTGFLVAFAYIANYSLPEIVDKLYRVQLHQQINRMEKNDKVFVAQLIQEFPAFYGLTCGEQLVKTLANQHENQSLSLKAPHYVSRIDYKSPPPPLNPHTLHLDK